MISRKKVFHAINTERKYQDEQYDQGRFEKKVYTVGEELVLMKVYLDGALKRFCKSHGDAPALHKIRQVIALGVRCMENHGALPREEKSKREIVTSKGG